MRMYANWNKRPGQAYLQKAPCNGPCISRANKYMASCRDKYMCRRNTRRDSQNFNGSTFSHSAQLGTNPRESVLT